MRKSISLAMIVALVCLPAFTGCKSRTKRGCNSSTCAPPPAPSFTEPPMAMMPPPEPDLGPPAPDMGVSYDPPPTSGEVEALKAQLAEEQAQRDAAARQLDGLAVENENLRRDIDRLADALDDLPPVVAPEPDLETGPVAPVSTADATQLAAYLQTMGGVKVEQRSADSVVVLVTDAFRSGSDKLKGNVRLLNALRDTAAAVKQHPGAQVQVIGHTDTQPIKISGWPSNTALSIARAKTVAGVLMDNGIDRNSIAVDGMGEMQPLVLPERSASDRAMNRRVEILIKL